MTPPYIRQLFSGFFAAASFVSACGVLVNWDITRLFLSLSLTNKSIVLHIIAA